LRSSSFALPSARRLVVAACVFLATLSWASAARADWDGDNFSDVIARRPDGGLVMYQGGTATSVGLWKTGSAVALGGGWQNYDMIIPAGDFSGDDKPDLLERMPDGRLFMWRGNGVGGFLNGGIVQVGGSGWQVYDAILPTDWNGDGKVDLIGHKPNGQVILYRGNGAGGFLENGFQISAAFSDWTNVLAPGDWDGDGNADLIGRKANGTFWLWRGNGIAGFIGSQAQIGAGWQNFDKLVAGDFTGDGKPDVIGRIPSDGTLRLYQSNGSGGFAAPAGGTTFGWGFNAYNIISLAGPMNVHDNPRPLTGRRPGYSFTDSDVTDRATVSVNEADGNVLMESGDVAVAGTGLSLALSRAYNSRSTGVGSFGRRMIGTLGLDQRLTAESGFLTYTDGTGAKLRYTQLLAAPSGEVPYSSQADDPSTLTRASATGGFTLVSRDGSRSAFDSDGYLTSVSDKDGNGIHIHYATAPSKRPDRITDTEDRIFTLGYNLDGLISSISDQAGRDWTYAYDGSKRMTSYTDPKGGVTRYDWDASDRITAVTSPDGRVVTVGYNSADAAVSMARGDDVTTFSYGSCTAPVRMKVTVTDPLGKAWTHCTDRGYVTKTVPPAGPTTTTTDDFAGMPLASSVGGATTTRLYADDDPFLEVATTDAAGVKTSQTYDSDHPNDVASETDELGNTTDMSYADALATPTSGRLETTSLPGVGTVYQYTYTGTGQLDRVTTGAGSLVADYGYDADGNLTSIERPAPRGTETRAYDGLSRATSRTDAVGRTETTTYDKLDRVTSVRYDDGTEIDYDYDGDGNMIGRTVIPLAGPAAVSEWRYDAKGQLAGETRPGGATTTYGHDAAGNLTSLTDDGGEVDYGYDDAGRLTTITEPPLAGASQVTTFAYDALGNRATMRTPNGVTLSRTFNGAGQETALSLAPTAGGSALVSRTYSYTKPATATPTSKVYTETNESGDSTAYDYDDALSRFTDAVTTNGSSSVASYHYGYDRWGNITQRVVNGVTSNYTRNNAFELLTAGATSFTWDAAGFLTGSSAGAAFGYNALSQTTSIQPDAASNATSLRYADRGQSKPSAVGNETLTDDDLGTASRTSAGGVINYTRTPDGEVIGERTSAGRFYFATDREGSVLTLTNQSGAVARKLRYDPYGATTLDTGTAPTMFGYAGGDVLPGGLVRFGERYYDPSLGRWTQPDPLDESSDIRNANPFAFAGGDPINAGDPSGLSPVDHRCSRVNCYEWIIYWIPNHNFTNMVKACRNALFDAGIGSALQGRVWKKAWNVTKRLLKRAPEAAAIACALAAAHSHG
jgi:RHS repeat-associated protein